MAEYMKDHGYTFVVQYGDSRMLAHVTVWASSAKSALEKVNKIIHANVVVIGDWRGRRVGGYGPVEPL